MSNRMNDDELSAQELVRRLKENMDMESFSPDLGEIAPPEEPKEELLDEETAEDVIRRIALEKAGIPETPAEPEPVVEAEEVLAAEVVDYAAPEAEEVDPAAFADAVEDEAVTAEVEAVEAVTADTAEFAPAPEAEVAPAPVVEAGSAPFIPDEITGELPLFDGVDVDDLPENADEIVIPEEPVRFAEVEESEFVSSPELESDMAEPVPEAFAEALASPIEIARPTTREVESEASDEPISDSRVDDLMRKYLTESEYDAVTHGRAAASSGYAEPEPQPEPEPEPEDDVDRRIKEAEEYVASIIENSAQNEQPAEPQSEAAKIVSQVAEADDNELDEVDVNLMIAFGMEEELSKQVGSETVAEVREALEADAEALDFSRSETVPDDLPDDTDEISPAQIKNVFRIYKRKQRRLILRFFGAALMTFIIFLFECTPAFGANFAGGILDPSVYPMVRAMVSLQLCFFVLAFAWKELFSGMKAMFTFRPTAKSVLALMTIFTVLYHGAICFMYEGALMVFCNLPIALCVLLTIVAEYMSLKRDIYSFNVVSSKRMKYVISEIPENEEYLERRAFEDFIDPDSSISRVSRTSHVEGFFRRTKNSYRNVPALKAILPLPIVIAIFFFIFSAFVRKDPYMGLVNGYISLMLSAPAAAVAALAIPLSRASKIAYEQGSAIIGEDALDEFSDVCAISFEDKDVFPSGGVAIRSIKVYGNNRIDRVIYNVASLFKYVGGPLSDVYSIATKDFECSDDVEIVDIADDGIEAVVSGKRIFLGREAFILRCGFNPLTDIDDDAVQTRPGMSVTYLVTNDEVSAKIYTQYSIDPGFIAIAKQLYRAGMCLGVKTFDPGIDDAMLGMFVDLDKYPIKIIKCHSVAERVPTEETADSGVVSKKSTRSLLKALALCENVNSVTRTGMFISMASIVIALVISAFLTFNGVIGGQSGLYVALYQLFWLIPVALVSRFNITK